MNEKSASEWLKKSWHNLSTAKLLYEAEHYTDVIAVELHYSCEKSLKAFIAYENKKIPKSHDLYDIYQQNQKNINLENSLDLLDQITKYHIEESYPTFDRALPSRDEIKFALDFTQFLFEEVCNSLDLKLIEIQK